MANITPVCGIQMNWAAVKMARLVQRRAGLFDEMQVELVVGTQAWRRRLATEVAGRVRADRSTARRKG